MPDFTYIARDTSGERITGTLTADGQREVMAVLASRALFPIEVKAGADARQVRRVGRVPAQLMATSYGQLADLLHSGVPLLRSLEVLQKQTSHAALNYVLGQVHRQVEDGATLAEAMNKFPRVFGEMSISMVRAGGEGGFLEEALSRVADFTEAQEDLKKRTIGAVIYPAVLAVVGVVVVTILIVFFVPKFATLFERLRELNQLPAITEWLLWTSGLLGHWGWLIAAIGAAIVWYVRRQLATEEGTVWWHRTKLRLPLVGPIFLSLGAAATLAGTLSPPRSRFAGAFGAGGGSTYSLMPRFYRQNCNKSRVFL